METLGQRISRIRKDRKLTQEDIAKKFNISVQAVSKWENDISSPDISILLELSKVLNVTVEYLLGGKEKEEVVKCVEEKKEINKMIMKIQILSNQGDKVNVNLPMPIILLAIEKGMSVPQISGNDVLKDIDLKEIVNLVEQGVVGELVSIESSDGNRISVVVE